MQDKGKFINLSRLKTSLVRKKDSIIEIIKKKESASETFIKVMMVLFFTHLHILAPITAQFSEWVSI